MTLLLPVFVLVTLAAIGLWVWALISVLGADLENDLEKLIWVIGIVVFPVVGSLIWLLWGTKTRRVQRVQAETVTS